MPFGSPSRTISHRNTSLAAWPGVVHAPMPDSTSFWRYRVRTVTWASRSLFSRISSNARSTRASRMYRPADAAGKDHVKFLNSPEIIVGHDCRLFVMFTSAAAVKESRNTRRVTFTTDCIRAPWFRTVTLTFTVVVTATAMGWLIRTIARSSSTSRERSAVMLAPAGEMFRTFHPVPMFPYPFEFGFESGPNPSGFAAHGSPASFGLSPAASSASTRSTSRWASLSLFWTESSTCQISMPDPGCAASNPACSRFSTRKYSERLVASLTVRRYTTELFSTCRICWERRGAVTSIGVTQPSFILDHALKSEGEVPRGFPFQDPLPITSQTPTPRVEPSVS